MDIALAPDIEDGFVDSNMIQQGGLGGGPGSFNFGLLHTFEVTAWEGGGPGGGGCRGALSLKFDTKSINIVGENK